MEKLDIINDVINELPLEYQKGYIIFNSEIMTFPTFLRDKYFNLYGNVELTKDFIMNDINKKLASKIQTLESVQLKYINSFIHEHDINEYYSEYLTTVGLKNMDSSFKISVGEKKLDLNEFYNLLQLQQNDVPTNLDKVEMCEQYLKEYLPADAYNVIIPNYNMTAYDYALNVLPQFMPNYYEITVNGETFAIEDFIQRFANVVCVMKEEEEKNKLNAINNVNDRPNDVKEVNIVNDKVTFEPVFLRLKDDERKILLNPNADTLYNSLSNLKTAIYECTSADILEMLINEYNDIKEECSINYQVYLESIDELIEAKKRNIIIIEANKSDFIDASYGVLNDIKNSSGDSYDAKVNGLNDYQMNMLRNTIAKYNIDDIQLNDVMYDVEKKHIRNGIIESSKKMDHKDFMLKSEIDSKLLEIKEMQQKIRQTSNVNYAEGYQVNLQNKINGFVDYIRNLDISDDEKNKYIDELNELIGVKENKRMAA